MSSISTSPIENPEPAWVAEVLRFWFVEISPTLWFAKNKALDQQIRDRFLATHQQLLASEAAGISGPRTMLAAVIVFDQFSRNLFATILVAVFGAIILSGVSQVGGRAIGQYSVEGFVHVFLAIAVSFGAALAAVVLLDEKPLETKHS